MTLDDYERAKFDLAAILRQAAGPDRAPEARDLFVRLAEDRFNLALIGRFSRGKTSLMNAMSGRDWLPTGLLPLTSVITAVSYGTLPQAVLHYSHTSLFMDVRLEELADHITERGNPGNAKRIRLAEVKLPAEILRRGFRFVDTPGLGSAIAANTRTTEAFLPEADAFLLVTSYDAPLSAEEQVVLAAVRGAGRPVFPVVNKADAVSPAERVEVEAFLRAELGPEATLFPVSARDALAARLAGDTAALQRSGVPALEEAITTFMANEARGSFLRAMGDRVIAVAAARPDARAIADRVEAVRARLDAGGAVAQSDRGANLSPVTAPCELCRRVADAVFDHLAGLQARLARDPAAETAFAVGGGLCRVHALQFERLAAPREICNGFAPVLDVQADRLERLPLDAPGGAVAALLPGADRCPACAVAARAGQAAAAEAAAQPDGTASASALCLPHLDLVVAHLPPPVRADRLRHHARLLRRLADDMRRLALMQDASRRGLASWEENEAALRGLRALLGNPDAAIGERPAGQDGAESAAKKV